MLPAPLRAARMAQARGIFNFFKKKTPAEVQATTEQEEKDRLEIERAKEEDFIEAQNISQIQKIALHKRNEIELPTQEVLPDFNLFSRLKIEKSM